MLVALAALVGSLLFGVFAHESAHAVTLRALGIPYTVSWGPTVGAERFGIAGALASVTPAAETGTAPWKLRLSALMPLALVAPFLPVLAGWVPDPVATGEIWLRLAVIGWLACAIPSPADFAVVWHPADSIPSG